MRPLLRWTIGPTQPLGLKILIESVKMAELSMPGFDKVICYNNISPEPFENLGVSLHRQTQDQFPLTLTQAPYPGARLGSGWKLCPPRLRPDGHELWVDNDIVIEKPMPSVESWLARDATIIAEGWYGFYGVYDDLVRPYKVCAGLFGLPPGLDFWDAILKIARQDQVGGWDEQGMTAAVCTMYHDCIVVPMTELSNCEKEFVGGACGYHFVEANRSKRHTSWEAYTRRRVPML